MLCGFVSCNVGIFLYDISGAFYIFASSIYYSFNPKEHVSLASFYTVELDSFTFVCVCVFFFPNRAFCFKTPLLLQKLLPASSINKVDHSLVKIKPYNSCLNLNRQGRMQTSLARRPPTIQATYRYFFCSCDFVMTA